MPASLSAWIKAISRIRYHVGNSFPVRKWKLEASSVGNTHVRKVWVTIQSVAYAIGRPDSVAKNRTREQRHNIHPSQTKTIYDFKCSGRINIQLGNVDRHIDECGKRRNKLLKLQIEIETSRLYGVHCAVCVSMLWRLERIEDTLFDFDVLSVSHVQQFKYIRCNLENNKIIQK